MIRALLIDLEDMLRRAGDAMANDLSDATPEATGDLKSSYRAEVATNGPVITLGVKAAPHFRWVELGRRKGVKQPPLKPIIEWCEIKGMDARAAYPIARSIAENGIAPNHMLKNWIAQNQQGLSTQIKRVFGQAVKTEFANLVQRTMSKKG